MFANGSEIARKVSLAMLQARMTHRDGIQIAKTYAKEAPPDTAGVHEDDYFQTAPMELDGILLHKIDNAWDLFLLRDFISRHNTPEVKNQIKEVVTEKKRESAVTIVL
jgi:hypothetical protein